MIESKDPLFKYFVGFIIVVVALFVIIKITNKYPHLFKPSPELQAKKESMLNMLSSFGKEGLENMNDNSKSGNGIGNNASEYTKKLSHVNKSKNDRLLIDKYRDDYENALLHMDDHLDLNTINEFLNMDTSSFDKSYPSLQKIATLFQAKQSLKSSLDYLDRN